MLIRGGASPQPTLDPRWLAQTRRSTAVVDCLPHKVSLSYTGVRVAELVAIRISEVDLNTCRIRITHGKGRKDRYVPFPAAFKETLALHISAAQDKGAIFLFESSWKKPYSTRRVRAMLARYATQAGLKHTMSPHRLRHFLFTWLKT